MFDGEVTETTGSMRQKGDKNGNADADKAQKERVEKINQADSMIFQTEKQLKEFYQ